MGAIVVFMIKKQDKVKVKKAIKAKISKPKPEKKGLLKVLAKIGSELAKVFKSVGGYFKGSWTELRQVRWTNRGASWGLTGAVILFSGVFVTLIVLLDAGFDLLFKLIIK